MIIIISANIIIVTVVIFGHVFVDMALFTPCLLKGRSCKRLLYPRRNLSVPRCLSSTQLQFFWNMVYCFLLFQWYDNYVTSASRGLHTYINVKETESSRKNRGASSLTNILKGSFQPTWDIQFLVISVYFILLGERIATKELSSTLPKEAHLCSQ